MCKVNRVISLVCLQDGLFIVYGTVVGLLQDDPWWYFACKCHKAVTFDDGLYFCPGCCKHVMDVSARCCSCDLKYE